MLLVEWVWKNSLDIGDGGVRIVDSRLKCNLRVSMISHTKGGGETEWDKAEIKSLMAVVLDNVRRRILTGEFKPGEKINESEIAVKLGISRSPVREAFRVLEREGLITTLPRKGSHITEISWQDLEELFGLRELLECHAVDGIKKRAIQSPDEMSALVRKIERELAKEPDRFEVISSFHSDMVELSHNYRLIELYKILGLSLRRYQLIYLNQEDEEGFYLEQHQEIVNRILKNDYSTAKKIIKRHIRYVGNSVKRRIKEILSP
jgi:DNA-binding GntR family transcriptional regulator